MRKLFPGRVPEQRKTVKPTGSISDFHEALDEALHPRLSFELAAQLAFLYDAGFSLLPLGGVDGKRPIVTFRNKARLPLRSVADRMAAAGSTTYGIRLGGMLVVDVDMDTPEAHAYVERRFGSSPVRTKTGRGYHLFFRHEGAKPSTVDLPGIRIDFKSGPNEFVVGPYSKRPDGKVYEPLGFLFSVSALPEFEDREAALPAGRQPAAGRFPVGRRHSMLKQHARELALESSSFDELLARLLAVREQAFDDPETYPESQVVALARWFWDKRESGQLWGGSNSTVRIRRSAIEALASSKSRNKGLATLLYNILLAEHGHTPDKIFAIVPDGLRDAGRLGAGRRQIYAALALLLDLRLVICRKKPRGCCNYFLYQFGNGLKGGGGSKLTLVSEQDTQTAEGLAA